MREGWKVYKIYLTDKDGIITGCLKAELRGEGLLLCEARRTCNPGNPQSGRSYKSGRASYFAVFVRE